jgi:dihydrophenazinedicarboxylate synthase
MTTTSTPVGLDGRALPEFDRPPADPIDLLRQWWTTAGELRVREPGAVALATADEHGHTSARIVALLGVTADGLVFTSHSGSRKGRELAAIPWASGVLYWRETGQQITVAGPVTRMSATESDALWESRPAATYPMSVASEQSAPLADETELRATARELADDDQPLTRPDTWCGYRLAPVMVEFWQGSPDRLHRRLRYEHTEGGWTHERLQP